MFDKLLYKLTSPKFCKHCGGELVTDVKEVYSAKTGLAIAHYVGVRCEYWYTCFEKYGYLYRWYERIS